MKKFALLILVGASCLLLTGCFGSTKTITCTKTFTQEAEDTDFGRIPKTKYDTEVKIELDGKKAKKVEAVNSTELLEPTDEDLTNFAKGYEFWDNSFKAIYGNKEGFEATYELTDRLYSINAKADLTKFSEDNYYLLPGFNANVLVGNQTFDSINEVMVESGFVCEQK